MATQKIYDVYHTDFRDVSGDGGGDASRPAMIVRGTFEADDGASSPTYYFTEDEGEPSWPEARTHIMSGGVVYIADDQAIQLINYMDSNAMSASPGGAGQMIFLWNNPIEPS